MSFYLRKRSILEGGWKEERRGWEKLRQNNIDLEPIITVIKAVQLKAEDRIFQY